MRNNHRPPTPKGVCLTGNTIRCHACGMVGALSGYRNNQPMALCAHCKSGYDTMIKREAETMAHQSNQVKTHQGEAQVNARQNEAREHIQAAMQSMGMNLKGLSVAIGMSASTLSNFNHHCTTGAATVARADLIIEKLTDYAVSKGYTVVSKEKTAAESPDAQHAVINVEPDSELIEAAHDLIFDALGIDLDELRSMSASIDTLICARKLGLEAVLHIKSGDVTL